MANTSKQTSDRDFQQTLKLAYNDVDASLSISEFTVAKVGRKITYAISTTSIANDTYTATYSESGTSLYVIKKIYTDGTRTVLISEERMS